MNISNIQQRYNDDDELIVSASLDSIPFSNITHEDDGVKLQERTIRVGNNWAGNNTNWKPVVNAVDIDWNNAKLDNVELSVLDNKNTVNTTGQLLALINDLQEQINAIVYIMNGGNTGGDNSGSGSNDFSSTTTSSTTTSSTGTPTPTQTGR